MVVHERELPGYPDECRDVAFHNPAFGGEIGRAFYSILIAYAPNAAPFDDIDIMCGGSIYNTYNTYEDVTLLGECIFAHGEPPNVGTRESFDFPDVQELEDLPKKKPQRELPTLQGLVRYSGIHADVRCFFYPLLMVYVPGAILIAGLSTI